MVKILFVAMSESVHTARWLQELNELNWDIHLFPSNSLNIHPLIKNATIHGFRKVPPNGDKSIFFQNAYQIPQNRFFRLSLEFLELILRRLKKYRNNEVPREAQKLASVIKKIQPDIIHTLEMQHAGYMTLHAKKILGGQFPPWIFTPWGSDLFLFGRLPKEKEKIISVLSSCDFYGPKSNRDIFLAKRFGFKGTILPVIPGNGGLDTNMLRTYWQPGKSSNRKLILVKGYQGIMNRSLVALHALELCSDVLKNYTIILYSAGTDDVKIKAQLMLHDSNISIITIPPQSHLEMLHLYGQARISISLSISDGVPNSLLESMTMGTFPIESNTSCADEWITDGKTGFIVPPEDPDIVAQSIRKALIDDNLIDYAVEKNFQIVQNRIDNNIINLKVLRLYNEVTSKLNDSKSSGSTSLASE